jgi:hypothetical protein
MASQILRLDAEATGPRDHFRLTIYFSHSESARNYYSYLQTLDSFCEEQECKIAESEKDVSMYLPSDIIPVKEAGTNDVILVFTDEDKAKAWEEKMILWTGNVEMKRSLSRSLTIQALNDKLGLSSQVFMNTAYEASTQRNAPMSSVEFVSYPLTLLC